MSVPEYGDVTKPGDEARVAHLESLIEESIDAYFPADEFARLAGIPDGHWERDAQFSFLHTFKYFYRKFDPETQQCFRRALVQAIETWNFIKDSPGKVETLAFMASDTRADEALKPLAGVVEEDLISRRDQEEIRHAVGSVISVIASFAGHSKSQEAQEILKPWFIDFRYERYAAMIMNGLCETSPDDYPNYLPGFLKVAEIHPEYFDLESCIREFVRVTTRPTISAHLSELSPEVRVELIELMGKALQLSSQRIEVKSF